MKFKINRTGKRLAIPNYIPEIAGIDNDAALEINVFDGVIVITKAQMTAMDAIKTIYEMENFKTKLVENLLAVCGKCHDCGFCAAVGDEEKVTVPSFILEEAGLAHDCKLIADIDDNGNIVVFEAGYKFDISDVPDWLVKFLSEKGICINELDEHLIMDTIVYDSKPANDEF